MKPKHDDMLALYRFLLKISVFCVKMRYGELKISVFCVKMRYGELLK